MTVLLLHRIQFSFTITYHYLFPQLTMGLPLLIVVLKTIALTKRDERYNRATPFWAKIFAVNFLLGVVTGIPMEFQFGTNWSVLGLFLSSHNASRCSDRPLPNIASISTNAANDITGAKALSSSYATHVGLIWWSFGMLPALGYFTVIAATEILRDVIFVTILRALRHSIGRNDTRDWLRTRGSLRCRQ